MVVGELAAPAVSKIITEAAQDIKEFDPTLTDREAIVLAGSALATAGIISDAKSVLKGMNNILSKLDSSGGLAFAGVGHSKIKMSEFSKVDSKPHTPSTKPSGHPNAHADVPAKTTAKDHSSFDDNSQLHHYHNFEKLGILPGPQLTKNEIKNFLNSRINSRLLQKNEVFYKYHGIDNRSGKKYTYFTNKIYNAEYDLHSGLAIEDSWGIKITRVTEFNVPAGTWIAEGIAGPQINYRGGDYQAIINNAPKKWITKTREAFKNE